MDVRFKIIIKNIASGSFNRYFHRYFLFHFFEKNEMAMYLTQEHINLFAIYKNPYLTLLHQNFNLYSTLIKTHLNPQ
jgi:hypothetical protein